jgi:hypothetical protein
MGRTQNFLKSSNFHENHYQNIPKLNTNESKQNFTLKSSKNLHKTSKHPKTNKPPLSSKQQATIPQLYRLLQQEKDGTISLKIVYQAVKLNMETNKVQNTHKLLRKSTLVQIGNKKIRFKVQERVLTRVFHQPFAATKKSCCEGQISRNTCRRRIQNIDFYVLNHILQLNKERQLWHR